ncbi:MAG TPA: SDR family oxidoreductase [Acidobacteriaceae bacterium]|nr:SDR family oxidoreductase [Acidobacteriaceae bacterium]
MTTRPFPKTVLALGATSAIGEATLRLLAERGARFYLVARSQQKLNAVAADLHTRGATSVATHVMDLDDTAAHPAMLAAAAEALGTIELALLAHGVLGKQEDAEASYLAAEAVLRTNFLSPVSLITWLANYFEATKQGTLAVISSVAGDRGRKSNYVYGASKGALNVFLDGVRARIDRAGVQVLTIKPGFVATPMTAHLPQGPLFARPSQVAQGIVKAIEKRRDVVYLPVFWAVIMLIIRLIPGRIFKKLNV